jgi:hypothetical protein
MKQMTPVEWLVDKICGTHTKPWQPEIDQALEMEKQQIIDAYSQSVYDVHNDWIKKKFLSEDIELIEENVDLVANDYYNETYRKQLKQRK